MESGNFGGQIVGERLSSLRGNILQGLIDPLKAGRGHATLIGPSQTARC